MQKDKLPQKLSLDWGIFLNSFLYYFVTLDGQIIAQLVDELVSFRFGILILRLKEKKNNMQN